MGSDPQPTDLVEIRTDWGPVALAAIFAAGAAAFIVSLTRSMDTPTIVAAACAGTQAASMGGLVALWFGADLSRRWSWLFALSLSWPVTLGCLLFELPLWSALAVGMTTALALGTIMVRRLAGFARRARGPSYAGVYLGPLLAVIAVLLSSGDGELGGIVLIVVVPLSIPFGAVVGALLGAER